MGANFHLNPLLLATFLYKNVQKSFQLRGGGLCLLTPHQGQRASGTRWERGLCPRPPFSLALRALAMVSPFGKSWIRHCIGVACMVSLGSTLVPRLAIIFTTRPNFRKFLEISGNFWKFPLYTKFLENLQP